MHFSYSTTIYKKLKKTAQKISALLAETFDLVNKKKALIFCLFLRKIPNNNKFTDSEIKYIYGQSTNKKDLD